MILDGERRGAADARQDHPRRHQRQHRHRLRHDRRGARLPRQALPARATPAPSASASCARLRRRARAHRPGRRHRRRDPQGRASCTRPSRSATSIPTSTTTPRTGGRTTDTTGTEIWRQTGGRVTHFVAGLGTSGTFMGIGAAAQGVQPRRSSCICGAARLALQRAGGLKHMATAIVPGIYDPALADAHVDVADRGRLPHGAAPRARGGPCCVGVSAGAAWQPLKVGAGRAGARVSRHRRHPARQRRTAT